MTDLARYAAQTRFPPLGKVGQARLAASRVLICGCGALGAVLAGTLTRAGVGFLRLVDRDYLELSNLQRQTLYDEADVEAGLPKAVAAKTKLKAINSEIEIEAVVAELDATNIERLTADVDILLDGTDNFETRFLLNDAAVKWGKPWVYGGCLGAGGQTMTIVPGETPCLRCLMLDAPPPGTAETCETAGVLAPAVNVVASIQAIEALKILSGNRHAISRSLTMIDLWESRVRHIDLEPLTKQADCPACGRREFAWLDGQRGSQSAVLCGRNAVQLSHLFSEPIAMDALAARLADVGQVQCNQYLLRVLVDQYRFTIFPDGRAIVVGTSDIATARTAFARYIGL